jgi:thymidylate kinase
MSLSKEDFPEHPPERDDIGDRRVMSRREFLKGAFQLAARLTIAGIVLGQMRTSEGPPPLESLNTEGYSARELAHCIRSYIDSPPNYGLEKVGENFIKKLAIPFFVRAGLEMGLQRNLNETQLFNHITIVRQYADHEYEAMKTTANSISMNLLHPEVRPENFIANIARTPFGSDMKNNKYYQSLTPQGKVDMFTAAFRENSGAVSYTDPRKGHVVINTRFINSFVNPSEEVTRLQYVDIARDDRTATINPTVGWLKLVTHELQHLDAMYGNNGEFRNTDDMTRKNMQQYPELIQAFQQACPPRDGEKESPIADVDLQTYQFQVYGHNHDTGRGFYHPAINEFVTDLLTAMLAQQYGIPTYPTYLMGIDYRNMMALMKHVNMGSKALTKLYYDSDIHGFYRKIQDALPKGKNSLVDAINAFCPNFFIPDVMIDVERVDGGEMQAMIWDSFVVPEIDKSGRIVAQPIRVVDWNSLKLELIRQWEQWNQRAVQPIN